jgi:hypothetical protein
MIGLNVVVLLCRNSGKYKAESSTIDKVVGENSVDYDIPIDDDDEEEGEEVIAIDRLVDSSSGIGSGSSAEEVNIRRSLRQFTSTERELDDLILWLR